ncbi:MAG: class I SAM-dependent methyltransferase [Candidatus Krumholzibacteria bacterium]|nr:class I SAM-dependent methyltransferase [Candidatus Krumholzibacteria bacterium]
MKNRRDTVNPWLSISAADYEGHMGSPGVRQLEFLSRVFGGLMREFEPESVVVLGCATGNGFEHIEGGRVRRLVGLDINPEYLDVCRTRYGENIPGLELVRANFVSFDLEAASIDFVHAALFFEYVDPAAAVEKISRWLKPLGILAVVLQLPNDSCGTVSETVFTSLKALEPTIRLVDPALFARLVREHGFSELRSARETLASGKEFFLGVYRFESAQG